MIPNPSSDKLLSIADAAAVARRSTSWIRTHRTFGPLEPAEIDGLQAVTAESLFALLGERRERRPKPRLRLVVDNTAK